MTDTKHRPFKCALGATVKQQRVHVGDRSEEDIRAINEQTLSPVTAKDVAVFRMDLCNDQIDRHISRFPREELQRISDDLLVGKPLMELHDMPGPFSRGSQPVGKFFRSEVVSEDGTTSVRSDVYLLRGHGEDDIIAKIEAGILAGTSISFALDRPECSACACDIRDCAHWPGEEVDGELCHVILRDVTDVFEGSIVPLGSQSTEFVQARGVDGEGEPVLPIKDAIKQARGKALATPVDTWELTEGRTTSAPEDTHPLDETDDELRTSLDEEYERAHEISRSLQPELTN